MLTPVILVLLFSLLGNAIQFVAYRDKCCKVRKLESQFLGTTPEIQNEKPEYEPNKPL